MDESWRQFSHPITVTRTICNPAENVSCRKFVQLFWNTDCFFPVLQRSSSLQVLWCFDTGGCSVEKIVWMRVSKCLIKSICRCFTRMCEDRLLFLTSQNQRDNRINQGNFSSRLIEENQFDIWAFFGTCFWKAHYSYAKNHWWRVKDVFSTNLMTMFKMFFYFRTWFMQIEWTTESWRLRCLHSFINPFSTNTSGGLLKSLSLRCLNVSDVFLNAFQDLASFSWKKITKLPRPREILSVEILFC